MNENQASELIQKMDRVQKVFYDMGRICNADQAAALFDKARVVIVPPKNAAGPDVQAALLTTCALAQRTFCNRVQVLDTAGLDATTPDGHTVKSLLRSQGVVPTQNPDIFSGQILIGDSDMLCDKMPSVRPIFAGWRGGVAPGYEPYTAKPDGNTLSAILASGIAVSEMFSHLLLKDLLATRRTFGFSLWDLECGWIPQGPHEHQRDGEKWLENAQKDPPIKYMPRKAWFAGLGHLGQAYLWVMESLVRFGCPKSEPTFFLQDHGHIKDSTHSTSVLTPKGECIGKSKARVCALHAEQFGICTKIIERTFAGGYTVGTKEPKLVFGGFDNIHARHAWCNHQSKHNFTRIVDAGISARHDNFGFIRMHTFPENTDTPKEIWKGEDHRKDKPNRSALYAQKLGECGQIELANQAVGVPYVGMVAAAFAVSEALRILHRGREYQAVTLNLENPNHLFFRTREKRTRMFEPIELKQAS